MFSKTKGNLRAWVAGAATYAFVIQLSLTAILATRMAAAATLPADPFAICHSDASDDGQRHDGSGPAAHQGCIICAVTASVLLSPVASQPNCIRYGSAVVFRATLATSVVVVPNYSPRTSRGPPQVA